MCHVRNVTVCPPAVDDTKGWERVVQYAYESAACADRAQVTPLIAVARSEAR
jgi:hypothetical protein